MQKVPRRHLCWPFYPALARSCLILTPARLGSHGNRYSSCPESLSLALVVRGKQGTADSIYTSWLRSLYGSAYFKGEPRNASVKEWKSRLQTFEQYQYESDLGTTASKGPPRLLDQPAYKTDFDLWLELILFRRRLRHIKELQALYKEIIQRNLTIPTIGDTANELWSNFLHLGWETNGIWKDVLPYAQRLQATTGASWPQLYAQILSHSLKYAPQHSAIWHMRLRENFKPSSADMKDIFKSAVSSESTLATFKRMYMDFTVRDMYSTVVPQLCKEDKYKHALKWHNLMMGMNDKPPSVQVVEPLLHHLAIYGKSYKLIWMTKEMADAGVPMTESTKPLLEIKDLMSREVLNRQLGDTHQIPPKRFTDQFCGRLFATRAITIEMLIQGLCMLGVDTIGPISVRELVLREFETRKSSPRLIAQRLGELKEAGISIGDSTFCMLVSNLAVAGNKRLLEAVVKCDLHPDAFEDRDLQESLLATYDINGDRLQADRTLAILTAKCNPEDLQKIQLNLLLRCALKRKDYKEIYQVLNAMQENMVPVSAKSSYAVRNELLSPREVSKPPVSVAELPIIIAIFQRLLRTGSYVNIYQWRELLRRLGMAGMLHDLRRIALWLAEWYSNPSFRAAQSSLFNQEFEHIPKDLHPRNPRHPLRILFPKMAQQAIVAWGFQHTPDIHNAPISPQNKGLTWRWGVELLRELRQRKVPIMRGTLSRACRLRLIAMYGQGESSRRINWSAREHETDRIEFIAREIERIWGAIVFNSGQFSPGDPRRLAMLKHHILGTAMRIDWMKLYHPWPNGSGLKFVGTFSRAELLQEHWDDDQEAEGKEAEEAELEEWDLKEGELEEGELDDWEVERKANEWEMEGLKSKERGLERLEGGEWGLEGEEGEKMVKRRGKMMKKKNKEEDLGQISNHQ